MFSCINSHEWLALLQLEAALVRKALKEVGPMKWLLTWVLALVTKESTQSGSRKVAMVTMVKEALLQLVVLDYW